MVSQMVRRSGISVCLIADLIQWIPDLVCQVGVGCNPEETAVFLDAWPNVTIIGFEALPDCYKSAKATYPGALINLAVGQEVKADVPIWTPPRHKDGSSLFEPNLEGCRQTTTDMTTLDVYFPQGPLTSRTLLWLDCEGSELDVLKGAPNFLSHVQVVNVEMTAKPIGANWCDSNQVHDFLMAAGFKRQWVHTQRTSAGQCDGIYVRPEIFRPEFCCCPCQIG